MSPVGPVVTLGSNSSVTGSDVRPQVAAGEVPTGDPSAGSAGDVILLADLAPGFPDPTLPYWWFSTTPLPDRRIPAGMPVRSNPGSRLPVEADYWCHEGDPEWTRVDRTDRPKPAVAKSRPRWRHAPA